MTSLLDQLIEAIQASGESLNSIQRGSGVAASQLCRLVNGETAMTVANVERVADYLGLEVILRRKRRGG